MKTYKTHKGDHIILKHAAVGTSYTIIVNGVYVFQPTLDEANAYFTSMCNLADKQRLRIGYGR